MRSAGAGELFDRAKSGERRAIGRLLTLVERGGPVADEIADLTHPLTGGAHVVGITGAPGAGKSTITGGLLRRAGRAAVLAVDPTSPISGGAILGDRIRFDETAVAPDAFIRSMATRGHSGGLSLAVPGAIRVFDAIGFDPVLVETVGVGQVEVEVAAEADTTIVVVTPGWGDAVQANKAGLLEVADIFVVNKADRPGAGDARRDLDLMLDLTDLGDWRPPIVLTTATADEGIDELWDFAARHRTHLAESGELEERRARRSLTEARMRIHELLLAVADEHMSSDDGRAILAAVAARTLSPAAAAHQLVKGALG